VRFDFLELPGEESTLVRPVVPVQVEDLEEAPQLCLVDTGATTNRFGAWLAEATGIDLSGAPESTIVAGGVAATAHHARAHLTIAGVRYDAPVTFCEPAVRFQPARPGRLPALLPPNRLRSRGVARSRSRGTMTPQRRSA